MLRSNSAGAAAAGQIEQLIAAQHHARMAEQRAAAAGTRRCSSGIATPSSPTSSRCATLSEPAVEAQGLGVDLLRRCCGRLLVRRSTALHPRQQLARVERLHDVVVGAHLEPDHPIGVLGHRGQHDHRHLGGRAQMAAERQPVLARHHDVEHHEIDRAHLEQLARLGGALGGADAELVPGEIFRQQITDLAVVVDDQDVRGRLHSALRTSLRPTHGL